MQVLVLASGSRYRAELLQRLNLPFQQCSPNIDESALSGESPDALASRLAREKADAGRILTQADALVIASDQVAACQGERLHKPGSESGAREQLQQMSGHSVDFYTALCLLDTRSDHYFTALDRTTARLRQLRAEEINRYIAADQPLDCAGSFKVESLGISLFESVESQDPTALIGLPMIALCRGLRQAGVMVP
ncbi:Maf family protein [Granulosicoccus sp. 3-233]|uniref:Maf family protein n=1 Tax=Granulosicoccus sp. 3-233 TaxID=3417969 RepID=UPI003D326D7C